MRILINCSNLIIGGGIQVAHSFLNQIQSDKQNSYLVILSTTLEKQINQNEFEGKFKFLTYNIKPSIKKIITGSDDFLNAKVESEKIEVVFSIFGPTYWKPRVKHIVGYAKPQYVYRESPFFKTLNFKENLKLRIKEKLQLLDFSKNNDLIITENKDVSDRLKKILKNKKIHTITNFYNQIFDEPKNWDRNSKLPEFNGYTLLTISANYPHKNLSIIPKVAKYLNSAYPLFDYRFVITIDTDSFKDIEDPFIRKRLLCIGKVNVNQCPFLYSQADAVFLPTLLECFTATYPEAMKMQKPLLTSDLDFARGLCGKGAVYFNPLDQNDIGDKIYELSQNIKKTNEVVNEGMLQLKKFDTYEDRANKYLELISK